MTDNASNNNTLMRALQERWTREGIDFDHKRHHVRCLAHIMNIAIQSALTALGCQPTNGERGPKCLENVIKKKGKNIQYLIRRCYFEIVTKMHQIHSNVNPKNESFQASV